jgi:hypothetical protein
MRISVVVRLDDRSTTGLAGSTFATTGLATAVAGWIVTGCKVTGCVATGWIATDVWVVTGAATLD